MVRKSLSPGCVRRILTPRSTQGRRPHSSVVPPTPLLVPIPPRYHPPFTTLTMTLVNCSKEMPLRWPLTCYRVTAGLQTASIAPDSRTVCMETPQLPDGIHTINATVDTVSSEYSYSLDYLEIVPNSGSNSSSGAAGPTSPSTQNVAAIVAGGVGGGVGGIIILATLIIVYCLLGKKRPVRQSQDDEQSRRGLCKFHLLIFSRERLRTYFSSSRYYPQT